MTICAPQTHWDLVLGLATDATPPQTRLGACQDPGDALSASVRRHAVAVMDAVDRNGLVAPWTALPHLFALTTDPNRCAHPCELICLSFAC